MSFSSSDRAQSLLSPQSEAVKATAAAVAENAD
jgi:hypothetical protein